MTLQDVLNDAPLLHRDETATLQLSNEVLEFIGANVNETAKTLETGAGISTIVFALKGTEHVCITPEQSEVDAITRYCARRGISLAKTHFHVEKSAHVLPRLQLPELDLVLLDGLHGFPAPFIDWQYTHAALKIGGILLIDNAELWTGDTLTRVLLGEPEWKLEKQITAFARTDVFRKLRASRDKEWSEQSYVVRNSDLARIAKAMDVSVLPGGREWLETNSRRERRAARPSVIDAVRRLFGAFQGSAR
jgi:predicted O-methyltransferase YrrM